MKYFFILLFIFLSFHSCVKPPHIYIGQTYFQDHNIHFSYTTALAAEAVGTSVKLSGVYGYHQFAVKKYPALVCLNDHNQLQFIMLSDSIAAHPGDFIRLSGMISDTLLSLGYSFTQSFPIIKVQEFNLAKDTHLILAKAQADYSSFKDELERQSKLPESKLIWPKNPEWQLFVDEKRSMVIAYFSHADLMYALDVNIVYDLQRYDVEQIYAREWFKGE